MLEFKGKRAGIIELLLRWAFIWVSKICSLLSPDAHLITMDNVTADRIKWCTELFLVKMEYQFPQTPGVSQANQSSLWHKPLYLQYIVSIRSKCFQGKKCVSTAHLLYPYDVQ